MSEAFLKPVPFDDVLHDAPNGRALDLAAVDSLSSCPARDHRPLWYRVFEIAAAAIGLMLAAPALAFAAVLIKLDSPGPVFFRQQRLGRGARPFTFVKLRTMQTDCDLRFPHLAPRSLGREDTKQLVLQRDGDPRVTRVGRWLRRSSIDELPNLWHVLTGDMALVGPRPEMVEILPHYRGEQLAKFSVPPGLTGYAQIYGRGDLTFLETLEHDLRYVQERSLLVDMDILARTIGCVSTGKGAW